MKISPCRADAILISQMGGGRCPEIAQHAAEELLPIVDPAPEADGYSSEEDDDTPQSRSQSLSMSMSMSPVSPPPVITPPSLPLLLPPVRVSSLPPTPPQDFHRHPDDDRHQPAPPRGRAGFKPRGNDRYLCRPCDLAFRIECDLKSHEVSHSSDRPHKTDCCQRGKEGFKRKNELKRHIESHSPRKHNCDACGKAYPRQDILARCVILICLFFSSMSGLQSH